MAKTQQRDFEGLQVVEPGQARKYPDHEGINFMPHSDKQAVYTTEKETTGRAVPLTQGKGARYCGCLSRRALIIVIAVTLCIAVGAAVGGGVGATRGSKKSGAESSMPATPTPTNTSASSAVNTSTLPVTTTTSSSLSSSSTSTRTSSTISSPSSSTTSSAGLGVYNCPAQNATNYVPPLSPSTTFEILCDRDSVGGSAGINGGVVVDLNKGVLAYSIESCIDACVASTIAGISCSAVTYGANVTSALARGGITGNCFLKSQRSRSPYVDNSGFVVMAFAA